MLFRSIAVLFALPFLAACGNPITYLKQEIRKHGYILYQNPLEQAGTGTLVGGKPNSMGIIADPQTCFPDEIDGKPTNLRRFDKTALGNVSRTTSVTGDFKVDFADFVNTGNPMFNIGLGFDDVTSLEIQFGDANIEYLDSVLLKDFYDNRMTPTCRDFLDQVGFIIQALRVENMKFAFKESGGGYIKLDVNNISEILDIHADVKFHIEEDYLLSFDSPKYIGYQLGRLRFEDRGTALYRASKVIANTYQFKTLRLFKSEPSAGFAPMLLDIPETMKVDNNSKYRN